MQLVIDQDEQEHIYSCLLVGNNEFQKIKKSLAKMNREDDKIDDELERNARLRKAFNPRADEEALEKTRAKDPAQIDIEEVASSGETGGARRIHLNTGPALTDVELRDQLRNADIAVATRDVRDWSAEERATVIDYLGHLVATGSSGAPLPDEPPVLVRDAVFLSIMEERLAMGPYMVVAAADGYEIVERDSHEVKETLVDQFDAEYYAAWLNIEKVRNSDITDDEIERWSLAGPWAVHDDGDGRYWIRAGAQTELCDDRDDARGQAARYNRTMALKDWPDAQPIRLDENAIDEIHAAEEAGEDDDQDDDQDEDQDEDQESDEEAYDPTDADPVEEDA